MQKMNVIAEIILAHPVHVMSDLSRSLCHILHVVAICQSVQFTSQLCVFEESAGAARQPLCSVILSQSIYVCLSADFARMSICLPIIIYTGP